MHRLAAHRKREDKKKIQIRHKKKRKKKKGGSLGKHKLVVITAEILLRRGLHVEVHRVKVGLALPLQLLPQPQLLRRPQLLGPPLRLRRRQRRVKLPLQIVGGLCNRERKHEV